MENIKKYRIAIICLVFIQFLYSCKIQSRDSLCDSKILSPVKSEVKIRYDSRIGKNGGIILTVNNIGKSPFCVSLRNKSASTTGYEEALEITNSKGETISALDYFTDYPWFEAEGNQFHCYPASSSVTHPNDIIMEFGKSFTSITKGDYTVNAQIRLVSPFLMLLTMPDNAVGYGAIKKIPKCLENYTGEIINVSTKFNIK